VNVRHGDRRPDDARQVGDIGHLLHGLISLEVPHQPLVGEDQAIGAHPAVARDAPAIGIDTLDAHHRLH